MGRQVIGRPVPASLLILSACLSFFGAVAWGEETPAAADEVRRVRAQRRDASAPVARAGDGEHDLADVPRPRHVTEGLVRLVEGGSAVSPGGARPSSCFPADAIWW
jgi:hypothetical protein